MVKVMVQEEHISQPEVIFQLLVTAINLEGPSVNFIVAENEKIVSNLYLHYFVIML